MKGQTIIYSRKVNNYTSKKHCPKKIKRERTTWLKSKKVKYSIQLTNCFKHLTFLKVRSERYLNLKYITSLNQFSNERIQLRFQIQKKVVVANLTLRQQDCPSWIT